MSTMTESSCQFIGGCDFGAPRLVGAQMEKNIYIEARHMSLKHYIILDGGRNERLTRDPNSCKTWKDRRRGWTISELKDDLSSGVPPAIVAFDFPFSLPLELLRDVRFNTKGFGTRDGWLNTINDHVINAPGHNSKDEALIGLDKFEHWKSKDYWRKRQTDKYLGAHPPLKDRYQNLFSMTLAGNVMLKDLSEQGFYINLTGEPFSGRPTLIETYPAAIAKGIGFKGLYKRNPSSCFDETVKYLNLQGIQLEISPKFTNFIHSYRSRKNDPDGADAFLCLVLAIAYREGLYVRGIGKESEQAIEEEGVIIIPRVLANDSQNLPV